MRLAIVNAQAAHWVVCRATMQIATNLLVHCTRPLSVHRVSLEQHRETTSTPQPSQALQASSERKSVTVQVASDMYQASAALQSCPSSANWSACMVPRRNIARKCDRRVPVVMYKVARFRCIERELITRTSELPRAMWEKTCRWKADDYTVA